MSSDRPLYVMDDDYIEKKYVKAEEERQRQEEAERIRREKEEAIALEQAEKQRKLAEAERRRKKEEEEHMRKLEEAKKHREEEDMKRRKQEQIFQTQLDEIEDELNHLETEKTKLLNDKLSLHKDLEQEREDIEKPLEKVRQEKLELEHQEQLLLIKMKDFERKSEHEKIVIEQKEKNLNNRTKELASKRREVQTDMLNFLQSPAVTTTNTSYVQNSHENGLSIPHTVNKTVNYPSMNDSFVEPSVEVVSTKKKADTSETITDRLNLLDEFLASGILTKDDYDEQKKQILAEFNKSQGVNFNSNASSNNSSGNQSLNMIPVATPVNNNFNQTNFQNPNFTTGTPSGMDEQIRQLDNFYNQGILGKDDYESAKLKIFQDFGIQVSDSNTFTTTNKTQGLSSIRARVPKNMKGGQSMMLNYNGKMYSVQIPKGLKGGQSFQVNLAV